MKKLRKPRMRPTLVIPYGSYKGAAPSKPAPARPRTAKSVAASSAAKPVRKALSYQSFPSASGKSDWKGTAAKYRKYATSYQKGQMFQGASGTWYRDGKKVYAKDAGPAQLAHPERVQRAYNLKVASDIESRHRMGPVGRRASKTQVAKALST